ncbi:MAG TPA: hypothetical protein VLK56_11105, partial [Solirubrobacterales bacterium]|nr:hypothetical protein [Solirubrobacterales bacterium]
MFFPIKRERTLTARLTTLLLATLATAALAAGCGGGEGSAASVTTSSLSKAQFVEKANAICDEGREKALSSNVLSGSKASEREALPEAIKV